MTAFKDYARYYDIFYRDKDYAGEAGFIRNLLEKHAVGARALLELGCGSGIHALFLAEEGFSIHGVDMSAGMLNLAEERRKNSPAHISTKIKFTKGDVRRFDCGKTYDAVISLFHVVSYQTSDGDLASTFKVANRHLKKGGTFIFDCWYGPAVLHARPERREKTVEAEGLRITRIANPDMGPGRNIVDVNITLKVEDVACNSVEYVDEVHSMRYLYASELHTFLAKSGFEVVKSAEWMTDKAPGEDTWGVYFVCKKIKEV